MSRQSAETKMTTQNIKCWDVWPLNILTSAQHHQILVCKWIRGDFLIWYFSKVFLVQLGVLLVMKQSKMNGTLL